VLEVLATDRASAGEFPAFCAQAGHELLASDERGGTFHFRLRKGSLGAETD
jgi:TusA-related sulfurtransferase